MSASAKTMLGDLPPSSSVTRFSVSVPERITDLPALVDPVKDTFRISGCAEIALPASSPPVTTERTPSGIPAFVASSASDSAVRGVAGAGFKMATFPAARQGASFHVAIKSGKFQGTIRPQIPIGSRKVMPMPSARLVSVSPVCKAIAPAKYSKTRAAAPTSHSASPIGLPAFRASMVARLAMFSRMMAASLRRTAPRSAGVFPDQRLSAIAARPAATAALTSASPHSATVARC